MTAFSFLALPTTLIACLRPAWLVQLAILFSIFEAAAAVALGGFGLQPALLPAAIFVAYIMLQLLLGVLYIGRKDVWWVVSPFLCVMLWAVVGSFLLPHLFAGMVNVWPQKLEPPLVAVPLEPTTSNLNQVIYIVIDTLVLVMSSLFFSGSRSSADCALKAYFASGFIASAIGFWQLGNKLVGLPYPETFLFSNPGWSILSEQNLGLAPRINGSFSEPAAFASYLSGTIYCTGWLILKGYRGSALRILFGAALVALMCSTSTTGYGVLALALVALPIYAIATGSWSFMNRTVIAVGVLALVLICAWMVISVYAPETNRTIELIVTSTLSKGDSSSYAERTSADMDSLSLLLPTYGLGVGWGSNRSSSLIPGTLANLGLWGCLAVVWFGSRVYVFVSQARPHATDLKDGRVIDGATAAIVGFLIAGSLSGPTITSVAFYILLGALIGTAARVTAVAPARRRLGQRSFSVS